MVSSSVEGGAKLVGRGVIGVVLEDAFSAFSADELGKIFRSVRDGKLASLKLSPRELETACLLLKGLSGEEIARAMTISCKTARQYIHEIYQKSDVNSLGEFFNFIFPT